MGSEKPALRLVVLGSRRVEKPLSCCTDFIKICTTKYTYKPPILPIIPLACYSKFPARSCSCDCDCDCGCDYDCRCDCDDCRCDCDHCRCDSKGGSYPDDGKVRTTCETHSRTRFKLASSS